MPTLSQTYYFSQNRKEIITPALTSALLHPTPLSDPTKRRFLRLAALSLIGEAIQIGLDIWRLIGGKRLSGGRWASRTLAEAFGDRRLLGRLLESS